MKQAAVEIIQEALLAKARDYRLPYYCVFGKLFKSEPSNSELKSMAVMYITERFIIERDRADKAEQKMREGIKECLRFIEQREPKEAIRLGQKYLS